MKRILVLGILLSLLAATPAAMAQAIVTDVIDAADDNDPFDATIQIRYEREVSEGNVTREVISDSQVVPNNEFSFNRTIQRMVINPRIGLYRDLELNIDIPIVFVDQTRLTVDLESATVAQGNPTLFPLDGDQFVGSERSGLGDMRFQFRYSPFNYQREITEPTWVIAIAYTAPTGDLKRANNHGVGEGLHQIGLSTVISRRAALWLEPYFSFHGTFRFPGGDTLFTNEGTTQTLIQPGSTLGLILGTELIPYENNETDSRFEIDLGFAADFVFEGREYTPLFEALGRSPCSAAPHASTCEDTAFTRSIEEGVGDLTAFHSNGITDVEQYGRLGGHVGLHYQPVKYIQLGATFGYTRTTPHLLTNADPGRDLDDSGAVELARIDPTDPNSPLVNEYSPTYIKLIDAPAGHESVPAGQATRFKLNQGSDSFLLAVHLSGKF
jgi:hypothetical protein